MSIEYEATFTNVAIDAMRRKLTSEGANLEYSRFLQRRIVFDLPEGQELKNTWLRLRHEKDQVTLTLKYVGGKAIDDQTEIALQVSSFEAAESLLSSIGCVRRAYQENWRELWTLSGALITFDEWPFLEPILEVEGPSEDVVRLTCDRLGLNYDDAIFCSIDMLYARKYGVERDLINKRLPHLTFQGPNPFESQGNDTANSESG